MENLPLGRQFNLIAFLFRKIPKVAIASHSTKLGLALKLRSINYRGNTL